VQWSAATLQKRAAAKKNKAKKDNKKATTVLSRKRKRPEKPSADNDSDSEIDAPAATKPAAKRPKVNTSSNEGLQARLTEIQDSIRDILHPIATMTTAATAKATTTGAAAASTKSPYTRAQRRLTRLSLIPANASSAVANQPSSPSNTKPRNIAGATEVTKSKSAEPSQVVQNGDSSQSDGSFTPLSRFFPLNSC
jgi:hypothetical protein